LKEGEKGQEIPEFGAVKKRRKQEGGWYRRKQGGGVQKAQGSLEQ